MREKLKSLAEWLNSNILINGKSLVISAFGEYHRTHSEGTQARPLVGKPPNKNNQLYLANLTPYRLWIHHVLFRYTP